MPMTVNGVGTHYYGKRNRQTRRDYCHSCQRQGDLASYDTRLWVVFLYIPVIPLGRKRIIDECPSCRRHYVAPLKTWETQRQLGISGTLEEFRKDPSPEKALETHAVLLGFHEMDQAKAFRAEALETLGEQGELLIGFAQHLDQVNSVDEAGTYYERQLALRPDSPEARIGVAARRANAGELDEARKLVDFLMAPGAGKLHPLGLLEFLAEQFHAKRRYDEALDLYAQLLREHPEAGQDHKFRAKVQRTEKAVHRAESLLPETELRWWHVFHPRHPGVSPGKRLAAYTAAAVFFAAVGGLVRNEYVRQHRTLYVVSGLVPPGTVQIDDLPPVTPGPGTRLTLEEGKHRVRVLSPLEEEEEIELATGFWERFWNRPVWVYNVRRSAALVETKVHYAVQNAPDAEHRPAIAATFNYFPHIDHPFEPPPDSVKLSSRSEQASRKVLNIAPAPPIEMIAFQLAQSGPAQALDLAEAHLLTPKTDEQIGLLYVTLARKSQSTARALAFLAARRDAAPINVVWHRIYQQLADTEEGHEALVGDYRARWQAHPDDGVSIYLYARLVDDPAETQALMQRAAESAPDLYWPLRSLAFCADSLGDWEECLAHLREAERRGSPALMLTGMRHAAMIGAGRAEELAREYAAKSPPAVREPGQMLLLIDAWAMAGRPDEIAREFAAWQAAIPLDKRPAQKESILEMQRLVDCTAGNMAAVAASLPEHPEGPALEKQLPWRLALGQPGVIGNEPEAREQIDDGWSRLALAIGYRLKGDAAQADSWTQLAARTLREDGHQGALVAALLEAAEPPADAALRTAALHCNQQGLVLSAVALRFPAEKARWLPWLEKLDVSRTYPLFLIHQTISALKSGAAGAAPATEK